MPRSRHLGVERVVGFEPTIAESESAALPLGYTPMLAHAVGFEPTISGSTIRCLVPLGDACDWLERRESNPRRAH